MVDGPNRVPFDPALKVGAKLMSICEENGLLIRAMGDTIGFCPPLIIDEKTINQMINLFSQSLDQGLKWAKLKGLV